jgi:twinkle protein
MNPSGNLPSAPMAKPKIELPKTDLPDWVIMIFQKRGIGQEVLIRNKIACNGKEIMFPYFKEGKPVNVKYRTRDKKFRQETGGEKIFYGLDDIKDEKEVIIVEGEPDKLACEEASFKNVISVPDGAPDVNTKNYVSKFNYLENCEKELEHVEKFIIAVDDDPAGHLLAKELTRRLGPERCYTVVYPKDCKDPNEVLSKLSIYDLVVMIEGAKPVPVSGVFDYSSIELANDRLYHMNGREGGESTGWYSIDQFYTVRPGEVTVVTGIPSHGKSEVIDAIMVNLAMAKDWRFATFSPENHPLELHVSKIQQKFIGKPFSKSYSGHMNPVEFERSKPFIQEHFYFIAPEDDQLSVDNILDKAKVCVLRYGIKGLSIDPWNEIDHVRPPSLTETEYISLCLAKIRRFARTHGVHIWLIAHPTKMQRQHGTNTYPVPTPYDISGSAHFRNKADNCITIWRDLEDESKNVEFYVQKIRFREIGKVGNGHLQYDVSSGRYRDAKNPH